MVEDFVEAERVYMHVVQNRPYDPASYLNLGLCRSVLLSGTSHCTRLLLDSIFLQSESQGF